MSSSPAIIYLLTNKITKKRYVGFTTNLPRRLSGHEYRAKIGSHDYILSNSIRKHGWDAFECTILAEHPDAEYAKNVLEPQFIKEMNTYYENGQGYNMTLGGEGTLGYKRTPEQCEHMSRTRKGKSRNLTSEQRAAQSAMFSGEGNPNYGKTHSPETRAKISTGIKRALIEGRGRSEWTEERRKNQSERSKQLGSDPKNIARIVELNKARAGKPGRPHTEEHKAYMSSVMTGRNISQESINKGRLSGATHLWVVEAPDGTIYETYLLKTFCQSHDVNPKTLEAKWETKVKGVVKRKGSCCWKVHHKIAMTDEIRECFRDALDPCWLTASDLSQCKTTSDSSQVAASATTSLTPKTSILRTSPTTCPTCVDSPGPVASSTA